jgi:hypothetical protein
LSISLIDCAPPVGLFLRSRVNFRELSRGFCSGFVLTLTHRALRFQDRPATPPLGQGMHPVFRNSSICLRYLASFRIFLIPSGVPSFASLALFRERRWRARFSQWLRCETRDGRLRAGGRPRPPVLEHHLISQNSSIRLMFLALFRHFQDRLQHPWHRSLYFSMPPRSKTQAKACATLTVQSSASQPTAQDTPPMRLLQYRALTPCWHACFLGATRAGPFCLLPLTC